MTSPNGILPHLCDHPTATCARCAKQVPYHRSEDEHDEEQMIDFNSNVPQEQAPKAAASFSIVYFNWSLSTFIKLQFWSLLITLIVVVLGGSYMYQDAIPLHVTCPAKGSLPIKNVLFNLSLPMVGPPWRFFFRKVLGMVMFMPSTIVACCYYTLLMKRLPGVRVAWARNYQRLVKFNLLTQLVEVTALLFTVYIMVLESPLIHGISMITFCTSFVITSLLTPTLFKVSQEYAHASSETHGSLAARSYRVKFVNAVLSPALGLVMAVAMYLHHYHCMEYAHSVFALAEYFFVLLIFIFHYTAVWDFPTSVCIVGPPTEDLRPYVKNI